jgi:cytochrome c oxidase cbb3-type subunit 2
MPAYSWLNRNTLDGELTGKKLETFNFLTRNRSHKDEDGKAIKLYSQAEIDGAKDAVKGKTEMTALIAYLQSLGHALK